MANIILPWYGNHTSIPSGWSRYTNLDNKYPKSSGSETAETTGGASTHTHTSSAHSHALAAHTHTFTVGDPSNNAANRAPSGNLCRKDHHHSGTSGAKSGGTTNGTAVTYGSVSNDPPYLHLIFIQSSKQEIPNNGLILWDQSDSPGNSNFKVTDGNNSTVNLNNKYIKGAPTNSDAGATGGSRTNVHSISHTHGTNSHSHANVTTGGSDNMGGEENGASGNQLKNHTHTVSFSSSTQAINAYSGSLTTNETVEPAYKMLMAYQNKAGAVQGIPLNTIAMTVDSVLPSGWSLCDGSEGTTDLSDKFIKITTSSANIGNTGGSNTHTHAAQNHSHTSSGSHHHTVYTATSTAQGFNGIGGGVDVIETHYHGNSTTSSVSASYSSASTSANSSSNQPPYSIVKYIQKTSATATASFLMMFT